jgi:hypothetical protein
VQALPLDLQGALQTPPVQERPLQQSLVYVQLLPLGLQAVPQ